MLAFGCRGREASLLQLLMMMMAADRGLSRCCKEGLTVVVLIASIVPVAPHLSGPVLIRTRRSGRGQPEFKLLRFKRSFALASTLRSPNQVK